MARIGDSSRRSLRLLGAAATMVGLLLSGCSGAGDPASSGPSAPTRTSGPLDEFFGSASDPPSGEEMAAQERQVQDAIVICMAAEGFEYRPYVPVPPDDSFFTDLNTRAFAEKYGYGIVNTPFDDQAMDPSADPNLPITDAMTPAELDAYTTALHGEMAVYDGGAADGGEPVLPDDTGCWGDALEQVHGIGPGSNEFDDLFERLGTMQEQAAQDPTVIEATQRWATCMSDAGHSGFADPDEPAEDIRRRSQEYFDAAYPDPAGPTGTDIDPAGSWTPPPPPADDPVLVALERDEISLALADFDCRARSGYRSAIDAAVLSLEERFVRDNRAELERFRDTIGPGGG
ncbi:hypothetical protein [Nakamurella sp.]|uniref:hypothetical protein n=1 Tax=Nakamurella sp. TaxID=1869182 RepID=UPI003784E795